MRHSTVYSVQSMPVFIGPDCRRNNQRERETFLFNHDQLKNFFKYLFLFFEKIFYMVIYLWHSALKEHKMACIAKRPSHCCPLSQALSREATTLSISCGAFQRCSMPVGASSVYLSVYVAPQPSPLPQRVANCTHCSGGGRTDFM